MVLANLCEPVRVQTSQSLGSDVSSSETHAVADLAVGCAVLRFYMLCFHR